MTRSSAARAGALAAPSLPAFGRLLREWRTLRRRSQLELALEAEVSARHISFVETGRAQPSREMVLLLASVLDVPLRERNALLQSAGFAPVYRETALHEPKMAAIADALRLILKQNEPFPAVALDRHWNLVMANAAYLNMLALLVGPTAAGGLAAYELAGTPRLNVLLALFDPLGVRPHVANWDELARDVLARVRREAAFGPDPSADALLAELVRLSGLAAERGEQLPERDAMVIPVEMSVGGTVLRFFTTITTLGAPQDLTLAELRIEAFHAADPATDAAVRGMARAAAGA